MFIILTEIVGRASLTRLWFNDDAMFRARVKMYKETSVVQQFC